jgi:hypothetical protein
LASNWIHRHDSQVIWQKAERSPEIDSVNTEKASPSVTDDSESYSENPASSFCDIRCQVIHPTWRTTWWRAILTRFSPIMYLPRVWGSSSSDWRSLDNGMVVRYFNLHQQIPSLSTRETQDGDVRINTNEVRDSGRPKKLKCPSTSVNSEQRS